MSRKTTPRTISLSLLLTATLFGFGACEDHREEQLNPLLQEDRASSFEVEGIEEEEYVEDFEQTKQEKQISQAIRTGRESMGQEYRVVDITAPKLGAGVAGKGKELKSLFGNTQGFDSKMNVAMSGEGGELVVRRGAGGMGMRGTGKGGGGDGFGRVGGLGKIQTRGRGGKGASITGGVTAVAPKPSYGAAADSMAKAEADRKRRLAAEVQSKVILGQIGSVSGSSHGVELVDVLTDGVVPPEATGGSEDYNNHGVNPMTLTSKDKLSTFSIDVDTGSYTIARRKLNEGVMPPASSVRVEEFVNYFNYNYPQPDNAGPFGVSIEAAPSPFVASSSDRFLMRVGVQGKRIAQKDRKPVHLVFLVDVSGSMNSPDKLGLAKESLKVLTNNLSKGDTVGLVTYAGATKQVLAPTSITDKGKIFAGIDDLTSGGGTAMGDGMEMAYKMAMQSAESGHITRVVVLSDGDANIGRSNFTDILTSIKSYVDEGVTLSTIGFGMGNYKDNLMEQLANKGNGNYYYIDTLKEARKVFGEQINGTLEVIAKDVKIQVEFNPEVVSSYRLVGYENRDIADKDFRNDKVDAGEIGAGHSVTAFYEVSLTGKNPDGTLAYVRMRHKQPDGFDATEQIFTLTSSELKPKLSDASKDFQFGAAVATFAEIMRGSPYAKDLSYDLVEEVARSASSKSQKDRQEFIALVNKAKQQSK